MELLASNIYIRDFSRRKYWSVTVDSNYNPLNHLHVLFAYRKRNELSLNIWAILSSVRLFKNAVEI